MEEATCMSEFFVNFAPWEIHKSEHSPADFNRRATDKSSRGGPGFSDTPTVQTALFRGSIALDTVARVSGYLRQQDLFRTGHAFALRDRTFRRALINICFTEMPYHDQTLVSYFTIQKITPSGPSHPSLITLMMAHSQCGETYKYNLVRSSVYQTSPELQNRSYVMRDRERLDAFRILEGAWLRRVDARLMNNKRQISTRRGIARICAQCEDGRCSFRHGSSVV
ncbi:hypothetical protein F5Y05DRAFT_410559 [Hypoxylon sp. FL0543]|nr:hypothetical protein F5Y05DRAFT_410559 [Hypoxylon sp. FL0543]